VSPLDALLVINELNNLTIATSRSTSLNAVTPEGLVADRSPDRSPEVTAPLGSVALVGPASEPGDQEVARNDSPSQAVASQAQPVAGSLPSPDPDAVADRVRRRATSAESLDDALADMAEDIGRQRQAEDPWDAIFACRLW
jgi:hypothetical protein